MLAVTNLYAFPWDPTRGVFNQQQFARLAELVDLKVLVPVPWPDALRRRRELRAARCDRAARERVDYFVFWYLPGVGRSLNGAFMLASLLLQRAGTVLRGDWHCLLGSWAFPDAVAVAALGKIARIPVVAKVHGTDINVYLDEPLKRMQIAVALRACRRVVAVSRALGARLEGIGVPVDRIAIIHNGVDPARFHPVDRAAARLACGLAPQERVVLYVGNLLASKGCLDLVEAVGLLRDRGTLVRLVLVGSGADQAAIDLRIEALGLGDQVLRPGRLAHEALSGWFGATDLFCLASHAEGVPNVVLEAMACGTPVVATDVGGVREVLPAFAGRTVPPREPSRLAEALAASLAEPWDRARIVEHARGFDWADSARRLRDVIAEACA